MISFRVHSSVCLVSIPYNEGNEELQNLANMADGSQRQTCCVNQRGFVGDSEGLMPPAKETHFHHH